MEIKKGYCRLKFKSGIVEFGEVTAIYKDAISFLPLDPAENERHIEIKKIAEIIPYDEADIPAYE